MTFTPRLVALDVDGTLVDHDQVMPESIRTAVARVVAAGVPVVIATGRGWHGTRPIVDALGLPPGEHVCSNGAVEVSYPPEDVVRAITFDARDVIANVRRQAPGALIAVEEVGIGYRLSGHFPPGDLTGRMTIQSDEELGAEPVTRVIVRDPNSSDEEFVELAERLGLHGVSYFVGWTAWLDISPEGIDKATGLADICARRGIDPADVLAIGDGRNDVGMMRWAVENGGRAVAMKQGPPEVHDAAGEITLSVHEGGVAAVLHRL